jgi:hypothetical protein
MGGFVVSFLAAGLPAVSAIASGLFAVMRPRTNRYDRAAGALGFLGGVAWGWLLLAMFLDQLKSRW